jgi:hypothetical protein
MSHGPVPGLARNESLFIAERRGVVHGHVHMKGNICDLSIISPGLVAFVCAMRLVKLSSTVDDILHGFAAAIARLRLIVSALVVSRELWLRTPRGKWRFFRILEAGIQELDCNGDPIPDGTSPGGFALPARGSPADSSCAVPGNSGSMEVPEILPALKNMLQKTGPDATQKQLHKPVAPAVSAAPLPEYHEPDVCPGNRTTTVPASIPAAVPAPDPGRDPTAAPEPEQTPSPGVNIELIRRFMRWRTEKLRKGTGSA